MRYRWLVSLAVLMAAPLASIAQETLPESRPPQTPQPGTPQFSQMVSYALGRSIAEDGKMGGVEIDMRAVQAGVTDVQRGAQPRWSEEQLGQIMQQFAVEIQQRIAQQNKQQGQQFLAQNARKPGVETTSSGLQYKVLKEGDGPKPSAGDAVICHYRGTFLDGTEFDSSYRRGQPAQFPVQGVIPGWTEALQMMRVGSKWQLFVPPKLAYGESGNQAIGPNQTLLFEVELLGIADQQSPQRPRQ